jgi:hypothetical protein
VPEICKKVGSPQESTKGHASKKETYQHLARLAETSPSLMMLLEAERVTRAGDLN